jgi:lipoyl(octanoyl) transferase
VIYPLLDLKRAGLRVRDLVTALEQTIVRYAARYEITAVTRPKAPGVYVEDRKLASVGIRVRRGASYHGLALNVQMDLEPFQRINPCGHEGLAITQLAALGAPDDVSRVAAEVVPDLLDMLSRNTHAQK